ncbi:hypothetical protein ACIQU6_36035 [Streptomyces sp. NPDC090442]|uniref:hypothetical protein n=1 Tax=Streptomyces sp. NPDC090442 TaxID=3365962 RepID=UPI00381B2DDD
MSHTELERLARIRIQVTGESLERALAVLRGDTADVEATTNPALRAIPDPGPVPEAASTRTARDPGTEPARQPPPPRRRHLRSV